MALIGEITICNNKPPRKLNPLPIADFIPISSAAFIAAYLATYSPDSFTAYYPINFIIVLIEYFSKAYLTAIAVPSISACISAF